METVDPLMATDPWDGEDVQAEESYTDADTNNNARYKEYK